MRVLLPLALLILLPGCVPIENAMDSPGCSPLMLEVNRGTLNGLAPTASMDEVKTQFPCATGETAEGSDFNFGGGVFFLDHGFFVYTHRDFIEVREGFRGLTFPETLYEPVASLGTPDRVDGNARLFEKDYGCLRVEADDSGIVTEVGLHAEACSTLEVPR